MHSRPDMASPTWRCAAFDALSVRDLYALMTFRQEVFVVEQRCAYLDADGLDPRAWHLWTESPQGHVLAYARLFAPGVKYPEASLGRVATALSVRRTGLGRELVAEALAVLARECPGAAVHISAQSYLERFYASYGFVTVGEGYLEDDIPHLAMERPSPRP